jgi:NAD dependent epimerase/dehydratase family enzyme
MKQHYRTFATLPVPAFVMRLLLGDVADELLLSGQRVFPAGLDAAGFEFSYPKLDAALKNTVRAR